MRFYIRQIAEPGEPTKLQARTLLKWMDAECFPSDDPYLDWHKAWWWAVAVEGTGAPAGFAGLTRLYDDRAYLCRSGVLPSYRGNRLQRRLVRVRERLARQAGVVRLVTDTLTSNPASSNTLIACGYRTYVPVEHEREDGLIYWYKDLA